MKKNPDSFSSENKKFTALILTAQKLIKLVFDNDTSSPIVLPAESLIM